MSDISDIDVFGLSKVKEKKKANPDAKKALDDIDFSEDILYRSEKERETVKQEKNFFTRIADGSEVPCERLLIDPNESSLFPGNPRNTSSSSIDDLIPLVKASQGNVIPALGRRKTDGKIEVIAGSRRRRACIKEGFKFLIDVIDATDEQAQQMAYIENEGRLDIDVWGQAAYYAIVFDNDKALDPALDITRFAEKYKVSRKTMSEYINLNSKVPSWLINACEREDKQENGKIHLLWTFNLANQLKRVFKQIDSVSDQEKLKESLINKRLKDPKSLISYVKNLHGLKEQVKPQRLEYDGGTVMVKKGIKNNTLEIKLTDKSSPELREEIQQVLERYKD